MCLVNYYCIYGLSYADSITGVPQPYLVILLTAWCTESHSLSLPIFRMHPVTKRKKRKTPHITRMIFNHNFSLKPDRDGITILAFKNDYCLSDRKPNGIYSSACTLFYVLESFIFLSFITFADLKKLRKNYIFLQSTTYFFAVLLILEYRKTGNINGGSITSF